MKQGTEAVDPPGFGPQGIAAALLVHLPAACLALLTVVLAGQPIYANDTWIHLALGEAFASHGPWLASDPHLYAAPGPPSPSSWLGSVAISWTQSQLGFTGLRVLHAGLVASILGLGWLTVRRVAGSAMAASAGVVLLILLSTYRLVQLRPDLFTIAATFAVVMLLVLPRRPPGTKALIAAASISALWANVHAAFLLGPILILGVAGSLWLLPLLPGVSRQAADRARARRLAVAGATMLAATLVNPQGWNAHLAYFQAGQGTLALQAVADEWGPTDLLAFPMANLPPTWAAWLVCWLCLLAVAIGGLRLLSELRRGLPPAERSLDPGVWALAVAGLIAALLASRFLWLGLFAVAVGAALIFRRAPGSEHASVGGWRRVLAMAVVGLLATGLHLQVGDWVLVSRTFRAVGADYGEPYYPAKFNAQAIWFLADTGVQGRIYNDYPLGGFMSFWLAPDLQMSSSGTMNVALEAMEANGAIAIRRTLREGRSYTELLDSQGIDLFLGTGLPIEAIPGRRDPSSVHHLEGEPGWIPVFRSLRSAVYLRRNAQNAENLARIAAYYAAAGVPFDPDEGLELERVISRATDWAIDHGVVPVDFASLLDSVRSAAAAGVVTPEMHRLATLYATLGLYDRALSVDARILRLERGNFEAARRRLWCLLRVGRFEQAMAFAIELESGGTVASQPWSQTVEQLIEAAARDHASMLSFLPLFPSSEAGAVQLGFVSPPVRERATRTGPGPAASR